MNKHLRTSLAAFAAVGLAVVGCETDDTANGTDDTIVDDTGTDDGLEDDGLDDDGMDDDAADE